MCTLQYTCNCGCCFAPGVFVHTARADMVARRQTQLFDMQILTSAASPAFFEALELRETCSIDSSVHETIAAQANASHDNIEFLGHGIFSRLDASDVSVASRCS